MPGTRISKTALFVTSPGNPDGEQTVVLANRSATAFSSHVTVADLEMILTKR